MSARVQQTGQRQAPAGGGWQLQPAGGVGGNGRRSPATTPAAVTKAWLTILCHSQALRCEWLAADPGGRVQLIDGTDGAGKVPRQRRVNQHQRRCVERVGHDLSTWPKRQAASGHVT
jgi:hypothetical protein